MNGKSIVMLLCAAMSLGGSYEGLCAASDRTSETAAPKKNLEKVIFSVGLHCQNCVKKVQENISFEKGVKALEVSLDKKTVTITYDPAKTDAAKLQKAIEKLGYKVESCRKA